MEFNTEKTEGTWEGWVILELLGHRKLGGYLKEKEIAGSKFLRLDVVNPEGIPVITQFYSSAAVYCITPCTQDVAVGYGANHQPQPVARWELPPAKEPAVTSVWDDDVDVDDEEDENELFSS